MPHRREEDRQHPHRPVKDELRREIEENQRRLQEHRVDAEKEKTHGQLHRR